MPLLRTFRMVLISILLTGFALPCPAAEKGWEYALSHSEQIVDAIVRTFPRSGSALEAERYNRFQSREVTRLTLFPDVDVGHINPERWRSMHEHLKSLGIVNNEFQKNRFLFDPARQPAEKAARQKKVFYSVVLAILALIALIAAWILSLRRTVASRTRSLVEEIAERKRAEQELVESRQFKESLLTASPNIIYIFDVKKARYLYINHRAFAELGYSRREVGKIGSGVLKRLMHPDDYAGYMRDIRSRYPSLEEGEVLEYVYRMRHKDGRWRAFLSNEVPFQRNEEDGVVQILGSIMDFSGQKQAELKQETTLRMLEILNLEIDKPELVASLLDFLHDLAGCDAVAIRLREGEDFPYYASRGFSDSFLESESRLCVMDARGQVRRNDAGRPVLECMCGQVITGKVNSSLPNTTPYGSFVTGSTTRFLADSDKELLPVYQRNRCHTEGYESVMLIPMRAAGETLGLIQFADRKKGVFPPWFVDQMERIAVDIANVLAQRRSEEQLRHSQERFYKVFHSSPAMMLLSSMEDGIFRDVNRKFLDVSGFEYDEIIGKNAADLGWMNNEERADLRRKAREQGHVHIDQITARTRSGEMRIFSYDAELIQTEEEDLLLSIAQDITEQKKAEQVMEKRMIALTRPLDDTDGITFKDLFHMEDIQRLQDEFADATGLASIITDTDGAPITRPSNFCRLCRDIIRNTEKGLANCYASDAALGRYSEDGPRIRPCLSGGLWDAGAGISVGGRHIANWLIGQVRGEGQTDERMRAYAREIKADENEVIAAFHEVPVMPKERFEKFARMLFTLAGQLSSMAFQNVQQARFISEKEKAEAKLRLSRKDLMASQRIARLGNWRLDVATSEVTWTEELYKIFGLDPTLSPPNYTEQAVLFTPESWERLSSALPRTAETGEPYELELETVKKDGDKGWMWVRGEVERNEAGEVASLWGAAQDITRRKRMELELIESQERFKALHNASFGGIVIHDQGLILECNQGMSELSGYTHEELIGMDGLKLISDATRVAVLQRIREGYEKPYEAEGVRKNGQRYPLRLEARNIPYRGKQVRGVEFRDLSAEKEAEKEKESLEAQLRQAQKMDAVGRLAGGVAHDFNNMLSVIIGYTEMALETMSETDPLFATLNEVKRAGERSADLTRQLLAFARKQTVQPKVLDLNDTVSGMIKMLQRLISEDINLVWAPGDDVPLIEMDPGHLDQILVNLCVNARDAIHGVGKLIIETRREVWTTADAAEHIGIEPGEYAALIVTDTGCGMDADTLSNIFEPFFTTKESGKGSGLGLATVYGAVTQAGGWITAESKKDQGAAFFIYIPGYHDQQPLPEEISDDQREARGRETILLVEDEKVILQMVAMMLGGLGYQVLPALTGEDAVDIAHHHDGHIDLLLTDVIMPEMNGLELSEKLLSSFPGMKRLFMSGYTADVITRRGLLEPGLPLIHKPLNADILGKKVREVLDETG